MIFTFDLYGTLVDWNTSIGNFLDLIGKDLREDFFKEEFKIVKNIKNFIPYSSILKEALKNVLKRRSIEYRDVYGDSLVLAFAKSTFFPDSLLGLNILKNKYKIGIISNTERSLVNITMCGLQYLFDFVITAEDTGFYKPNEMAFIKAWEIMKIEKNEIVHVSAYPEYDLNTSDKLGVRTILIDRYGYDWKEKVKNIVDLVQMF